MPPFQRLHFHTIMAHRMNLSSKIFDTLYAFTHSKGIPQVFILLLFLVSSLRVTIIVMNNNDCCNGNKYPSPNYKSTSSSNILILTTAELPSSVSQLNPLVVRSPIYPISFHLSLLRFPNRRRLPESK